jgi:hypothetical protein
MTQVVERLPWVQLWSRPTWAKFPILSEKQTKSKRTEGMAQVVEHLPWVQFLVSQKKKN